MAIAGRVEEVEFADAFMAQPKILIGPAPEFGPARRGIKASENRAQWAVGFANGINPGASLRVNHRPATDKPFTITLVLRERFLARLCWVSMDRCEMNPVWAQGLKAPPEVCGPHFHAWAENREHVLMQEKWETPCRFPLPADVVGFRTAFQWMAKQVNLSLDDRSAIFDLPATWV